MSDREFKYHKREKNCLDRALDIISRMDINNKTSIMKQLVRVLAVKEKQVLDLKKKL